MQSQQSVHSQSVQSKKQIQQQQQIEEESIRSSMHGSRRQEELSVRDDIQEPTGPDELTQPVGARGDFRSSNEYSLRDGGAGGYKPLRGSGGAQQQQFYLRDSSQGQYNQRTQYQQRPVSGNQLGSGSAEEVNREFTRMSLANSRFEAPATTGPSSDDTRDRIINSYREEIKNHQARERDFKILQEVIADLQRKVRGLENEIGSCQRDHEDHIREQNKVINNLGGDLEQVKRSIQDNQAEGIQVFDQIQAVKRTIDDRNQEIAHTSADLEKVRLYNESARRDIEQLHSDIAYQNDIKKKQQNGIYQLKGDQRGREKEVEEQKLRIQVLDREERQLSDRIKLLTENIDQRVMHLEKTSVKLDGTLRDCDQVRGSVNSLEYQVQEFVRSNGQAVELQKRLFRQKDSEVIKNQDLDKGVRITDQNIKDLDCHIESLNHDLEGMRYSNEALVERNYDLRQELESLNRHQRLLAEQNNELQRELDGFIETDEIVKRNLDRKDKVQQIRQQVDEVIKRSMIEVRTSRSPIRGGQRTMQYDNQNTLPQQQQFPNSYNFGNQAPFEMTNGTRGPSSPLRRTQNGGY